MASWAEGSRPTTMARQGFLHPSQDSHHRRTNKAASSFIPGDIVTILAGPEATKFTISKARFASDPLSKRLPPTTEDVEAASTTLRLPDQDPRAVELFLHYVCFKCIPAIPVLPAHRSITFQQMEEEDGGMIAHENPWHLLLRMAHRYALHAVKLQAIAYIRTFHAETQTVCHPSLLHLDNAAAADGGLDLVADEAMLAYMADSLHALERGAASDQFAFFVRSFARTAPDRLAALLGRNQKQSLRSHSIGADDCRNGHEPPFAQMAREAEERRRTGDRALFGGFGPTSHAPLRGLFAPTVVGEHHARGLGGGTAAGSPPAAGTPASSCGIPTPPSEDAQSPLDAGAPSMFAPRGPTIKVSAPTPVSDHAQSSVGMEIPSDAAPATRVFYGTSARDPTPTLFAASAPAKRSFVTGLSGRHPAGNPPPANGSLFGNPKPSHDATHRLFSSALFGNRRVPSSGGLSGTAGGASGNPVPPPSNDTAGHFGTSTSAVGGPSGNPVPPFHNHTGGHSGTSTCATSSASRNASASHHHSGGLLGHPPRADYDSAAEAAYENSLAALHKSRDLLLGKSASATGGSLFGNLGASHNHPGNPFGPPALAAGGASGDRFPPSGNTAGGDLFGSLAPSNQSLSDSLFCNPGSPRHSPRSSEGGLCRPA